MIEVCVENVIDYLRQLGRPEFSTGAQAEWLAGGVSNIVLRVTPQSGNALVIKQSREQLRTQVEWFSCLDRIYREVDLMKMLVKIMPAGVVPIVLFEDRENYLFAMEAIPADHVVWKSELLSGKVDSRIAETVGTLLATIHRKTSGNPRCKELWSDREVFDQLRVDPFYRRIVTAHPELRVPVERMVEEMLATAICIVHGDFSPKNILIAGDRLTLVDYETGHYGDPAFDLGFFLSHLLLKTVLHAERKDEFLNLARAFWQHYLSGLGELTQQCEFSRPDLGRRTIDHLAACMLSRIDGKSPIDYLPQERQQKFVRQFSRDSILAPPENMEGLFEALDRSLNALA